MLNALAHMGFWFAGVLAGVAIAHTIHTRWQAICRLIDQAKGEW